MNEGLSDDARLVLAFIRDHTGHRYNEIAELLGIDKERALNAVEQLVSRGLIMRRLKPIREFPATSASSIAVYYPVQ